MEQSNWLLADASIMRTIRGCNTCRRRGTQNRIGRRGKVVLDSGEPPEGGEKACRHGGNFSKQRNYAEGRRKFPAPAPELPGRGAEVARGGGKVCRHDGNFSRRRNQAKGRRNSRASTAEVARERRTTGFSPPQKTKSRPEGGFNSAKTYVRRSDTECWSRSRRAEETAAWCCP